MAYNLPKCDQPCAKPIVDTWGAKKDAGCWNIDLQFDYKENSIYEHNCWYASTVEKTIQAFHSLARIHKVYVRPTPSDRNKVKGISVERQSNQLYEEYLANISKAIREYPVDIDSINIKTDFFVYARTKETFPKITRVWVREFGQSISLGDLNIYLNIEEQDPYASICMEHTLFYPFCYNADDNNDNTELFDLNRPLLEEALRNWENEFNSEIEADGLPGIYKYGYLPQDQW